MKFLLGRPFFSVVYECKKGVEIGLPICVLCHLAKSNQAWERRPNPGKPSSRQGACDFYKLARTKGSQTGPGASKEEEEKKEPREPPLA